MILGVVKGAIYSTINHPVYDHRRLLIVDRIHPDGTPTGGYIIALDTVYAGDGETVLVIDEGNSSRQVIDDPMAPVRSVIIGVVDEIAADGRTLYRCPHLP
ncbi:MAG: EutN/CcmL family microcompartment protein [Phycisphaerales bacterium]|jgi:microcompartment protein CcmK/EutM|nr:MAG: EutN/CcmL family microcompartment protein [Phycisphaerales bacterium]